MKEITLGSGYCCALNEKVLDNMELLELLVEVEEGHTAALIPALDLILGREQRKALYDHLRTEDGRVPIADTIKALAEIIRAAGGKN